MILKRLLNLWELSKVNVPKKDTKNWTERYVEKLNSKRMATIIDLEEKPQFELKSTEL